MTFDLTYRLSEAEFMAACRSLWGYRAIGSGGNMVLAAVIGALGAFLLWQGVPGVWAPVLIVGAAVILAMTVLRDILWRRFYRDSAKFSGDIQARFSEDAIHVRSQEGENQLPWDHFRKFLRTDDAFFLIRDGRHFSIIPMTAFADPAEVLQFEGLVSQHLARLPRRYL